jgi:hypothetical protein
MASVHDSVRDSAARTSTRHRHTHLKSAAYRLLLRIALSVELPASHPFHGALRAAERDRPTPALFGFLPADERREERKLEERAVREEERTSSA